MDDFSKQKIIYPDIMRMPKNPDLLDAYPYFYLDAKGYYIEATNFMLTGKELESIFSFFISDIGFYAFSKFYSGPQFDATGFRYKKEYMNNFYVPILNQQDTNILKSCLSHNNFDINKIDITIDEIYSRSIGLEKIEIETIKAYKRSLLLEGMR